MSGRVVILRVEQPSKKKNLLSDNPSLHVILAIIFVASSVLIYIFAIPQNAIRNANVIFEKESRYHYIRVVDDNEIRSLLFMIGPGAQRQSAIYLDSPDKHVLDYSKMVFASLAFVHQPQHILVIGLGGGIIPSTFAKYFPSAQIDVVEIDSDIVKVAEDFFNFQPSAQTNIIVADGRVYVRQAKHKDIRYDIIVLDAFNGSYIPSHLTTKEFLQEVFYLLKDGGCVVSNIHSKNKLYEYQQRTYSEVALQNYVFEGAVNTIVISRQQKNNLTHQEVRKKLIQLQNQFQFSFNLDSIGKRLIEKPSWDTEGDILTDDYSPVNVLKSKKL
jgi:spermidine synthase